MPKEPPKWPGRISAWFAQRRWAQIALFLVLSLPPLVGVTVGPVALMMRLNSDVKASQAYVQSLEAALASQELRDALGEPIEAHYWTEAQMLAEEGEEKMAYPNVRYDVSGPKGTARIQYVAEKVDGVWKLMKAEATLDPAKPAIEIWPIKKTDQVEPKEANASEPVADDAAEPAADDAGAPSSIDAETPVDQPAK
jgi:hypothetical protein